MLQFALPWLFLLLPLPWLMRRVLPEYRESRPAVRVPFMDLLRRLTGQQGDQGAPTIRRLRFQWVMLGLVWLALVTALARPQWLAEPVVSEMPMRDMLVALDLSGSMDTQDFVDASGEMTDRLTAAARRNALMRRSASSIGCNRQRPAAPATSHALFSAS